MARWAFYLLGFPGLLLALLVFFLREMPCGRTETATVRYTGSDWKILLRSVPLRYLYVGYALLAASRKASSCGDLDGQALQLVER